MNIDTMTFNGWAQIVVFCVVVALITRPLGGYLFRVFAGERTLLSPVLAPVERGFYRRLGYLLSKANLFCRTRIGSMGNCANTDCGFQEDSYVGLIPVPRSSTINIERWPVSVAE